MGIDIKSLLNFKDMKNFLEETGSALVAYSIFLTVLMMIFDADYIQAGNVYHKITIFILFTIILFLGFFIFAYSRTKENLFAQMFAIATLVFPLFFFSFLEEGLQDSLTLGGYSVVLILTIILATVFSNILLVYIQKNYFKESRCFAVICLLIAIGLFCIVKYTNFVKFLVTLLNKIIFFSSFPDLLQIIFMGIEIGVFIGIVLAPALAFIRYIFPNKNEHNK